MSRLARDARIAGVAALDQPLRRGLYDLVAQHDGWLGRDEAADAMDVPRSVAAFHLDKLVAAGLLEVRFERPLGRVGPGAGRPAKKYRRAGTEVSVSLPDRHYDFAGALLADAVLDSSQTGGPVMEALSRVAHAAGVDVGAAARAHLPKQVPIRTLRRAALDALREWGYEPREARGEILLPNCPFHLLAERHPTLICGMNLELLGGLAAGLEAGDRLVPRLDPAPEMCCVRIATP